MEAYTIKDIENLSGIKAHTIRIWEQRYTFLKPQRTDTNIRYYTGEELKKILNISLLNKYGFKISHISRMCDDEICDKVLNLNAAEACHERIINELVKNLVDLDTTAFEKQLDKYARKFGIEKLIVQVIFPFLEKVGMLWQTGHINAAQEHLVSNLIRQKMIVGIDSVVCNLKMEKKFLLFLPHGEYHELGLLFMHYILKSRGAEVIYLGASVPVKDIEYVVHQKKPDYIFSHITPSGSQFDLAKYLTQYSERLSKTTTIITGTNIPGYKKHPPKNITLYSSLSEIMEFISSLYP